MLVRVNTCIHGYVSGDGSRGNYCLYRRHIDEMRILIFIAIAIGAIIIALLTVSFQAYKASGTNPAEALKVE